MSLSGKRALVTAAGQGVGRAAAVALAQDGATVIATDLNRDALDHLSATSDRITLEPLDVLGEEASSARVARVAPIDALVNGAGDVHDGTILDCAEKDWDRSFDLDAKAMFRLIEAASPEMLERGGGSIIDIASVVSSPKGAPTRLAYGVSKAATIGMTKSVASDLVKDGVRCNAIRPGAVESPSLRERLAATGDFDKAHAVFTARQPMGRFGAPEEIAALVGYLASDASAFTAGRAGAVDGGWSN